MLREIKGIRVRALEDEKTEKLMQQLEKIIVREKENNDGTF